MNKVVDKTVNLDLVGVDGNAFMILAVFQRQARTEGWTPNEILLVVNEATRGDYDHLLATIVEYCDPHNEDDQTPRSDED